MKIRIERKNCQSLMTKTYSLFINSITVGAYRFFDTGEEVQDIDTINLLELYKNSGIFKICQQQKTILKSY